ncbi:MAG TPA: hypothetical protein HA264_01670 [Methanolinea sp.]|nr:hypothetical protein [Methanolinea sp.]HNQ29323.1 hypothetical protein [Methanolinea sp.]
MKPLMKGATTTTMRPGHMARSMSLATACAVKYESFSLPSLISLTAAPPMPPSAPRAARL